MVKEITYYSATWLDREGKKTSRDFRTQEAAETCEVVSSTTAMIYNAMNRGIPRDDYVHMAMNHIARHDIELAKVIMAAVRAEGRTRKTLKELRK